MKEKGFKRLTSLKDARETFFSEFEKKGSCVSLQLNQADGEVLAKDVSAARPVPHYRRAAMDGYAVKANETFGASTSSPNRLNLGEQMEEGCAVPVNTGGLVPEDADAVLKFEDTRKGDVSLDVLSSVAPGENVSPIGEDVQEGDLLAKKGDRITPSHLGLFRSVGIEEVEVMKKVKVGVVPTGEELVPAGKTPAPGQTVQSNGIMLTECVARWGGIPQERPVLTDEFEKLKEAIHQGLPESDVLVFTGGSSVGRRDRVVEAIEAEGDILIHGVAVQPGKPLALGKVYGKPVLALPGYPVAAMVDAHLFLRPLILYLTEAKSKKQKITVPLGKKISSPLGKLSVVRVTIADGKAYPIRVSGSGVLSSVTRSEGFVRVPEDSEGKAAGEEVKVESWW